MKNSLFPPHCVSLYVCVCGQIPPPPPTHTQLWLGGNVSSQPDTSVELGAGGKGEDVKLAAKTKTNVCPPTALSSRQTDGCCFIFFLFSVTIDLTFFRTRQTRKEEEEGKGEVKEAGEGAYNGCLSPFCRPPNFSRGEKGRKGGGEKAWRLFLTTKLGRQQSAVCRLTIIDFALARCGSRFSFSVHASRASCSVAR